MDEKYNLKAFYGEDKYCPKMCGYCLSFLETGEINIHGRQGYCYVVEKLVYRSDWCHKPEEIEAHKQAMSVYVDGGKNKHGHEHAYSGTPRLGRGAGSRDIIEYLE